MKILGAFFYSLLIGLFNAFVFTKLWAWFILPLFDVPELTFWYGYGIVLVVGFLTKSRRFYTLVEEDYYMMVLVPLVAWGVGAIVHFIII